MKRLLTLFVALSCCLSVTTAQVAQNTNTSSKKRIQVTDLLKIQDVGNIEMSPNGEFAIYSVRKVVDADKKWEHDYQNQWFILRFDGAQTQMRPLTEGKENFSQPRISPDSKKILFSKSVNGKSQLFILYMDGGFPVQLTNFKHGASGGRWSPDGKKIVFSASFSLEDYVGNVDVNPDKTLPEWSFEKPGFNQNENLKALTEKPDPNGDLGAIRAYLQQNEKDRKAKVFNKLRFQSERSTSSSMSVSHLFVVDSEANTEPIQLTKGFISYGGAEFRGPDSIWFSGRKPSDLHPEREKHSQIYAVALNGKGFRTVMAEPGASFRLVAMSDDGNQYAYVRSLHDTLDVPPVHFVRLEGKKEVKQTVNLDRSLGSIKFVEQGKAAYFTVSRNGGTVLYHYNFNTKNLQKLTSDDVGINQYALSNNRILYSQTDITNPSELYIADLQMKNPIRITNLNTEWLKDRELTGVEKGTFINEKGMEVEYWIMKPVGFQSGKKYPLMLQIHGGPASMWGPGVMSMWHEYQYFAAQGYGIVYANPRGSSGYGVKFLQGNYKDWGVGPASDVLTAVDKAVAQGWVDTDKMVVTGGSYAGYLTNWIISHDHRFAAASSQRGVYHLTTFYGEGNASSLVPNYFGGYPWEPEVRKLLEEQSPYNYVNQIQTPFLIFHGEVDLRTGVIQSEMLYKSLKQLGKEVEYVRHPNADHELTRSGDNRQRVDQMLRIYEFFARYIRP